MDHSPWLFAVLWKSFASPSFARNEGGGRGFRAGVPRLAEGLREGGQAAGVASRRILADSRRTMGWQRRGGVAASIIDITALCYISFYVSASCHARPVYLSVMLAEFRGHGSPHSTETSEPQ